MGLNSHKLILIILFMNLINGLVINIWHDVNDYSLFEANLDIQNTQLSNLARNYTQSSDWTRIQRTGLITESSPGDPIGMGLSILDVFVKGLYPIILYPNIMATLPEKIVVSIIQLSQGAFYALIILQLYFIFKNKGTQ